MKVWKFRISLGWLCSDILRAVDNTIQSSFTDARTRIVQRIKDEADALLAQVGHTTSAVNDIGRKFIHDTFDTARTTATVVFLLLLISSIVSNVLLVCGLIGGLNLVFGRLLFDRKLSPRVTPTKPLGFRLDQTAGSPAKLEYVAKNQIALTDVGYDHRKMPDWFVDLRTTRSGEGTHMRLCVPQPISLALRRIFSGRYLMTRISLSSETTESSKPTISVLGDAKIVCIKVAEGQRVIFRVADLRAFSMALKLRSVYTAHVGTHILGLGAFYAVAEGKGHLILASDGEQVKLAPNGGSFLSESMLCWDSRSEFTLAQVPSFLGIWLNEPSLVSNSVSGSGLLDEGRPNGSGMMVRLWRLFRFLFMPF
ncbi:hypothetical protein [Rhizobium ruizarguesonis]|uniref:hypothetical protein n=1 Tax=Rhizobium ruizarguesonis TaxID=2081791 RepID=UPI0010310D3B|nr:hypothetical protein [Rhizobium ruizarguesonis]TBD47124.1 hypothetical protein ELH17_08525 [Rhizobium ruizarguesonis]